jgi:putative peptidoglycan lipid II flippase
MRRRPTSSLIITVLGLITVIPSMLQLPIATASYTPSTTDAFFLATVIPMVLSAPLFNAVASTLVPALFRAQGGSHGEATLLAQSVSSLLILATASGSILIAIVTSLLSQFYPHLIPVLSDGMVARFVWWLLPWVVIQSPVTVLQSYALACGKTWLPSLANLAQQVSIVALLYGFSHLHCFFGLPLGYILGSFIQLPLILLLLPQSRKVLQPAFSGSEALERLLIAAKPVCIGTFAMQGGVVATRIIASGFGSGAITALECATKLNTALLDITCNGILTTSFARWSQHVSRGSVALLRRDFVQTVLVCLFFLGPFCIALFVARTSLLITWLGKLYASNPALVIFAGQLFGILVLSLPFEAAGRLAVRLYLAGHQTFVPSILGIARVFASITLLVFLTPLFSGFSLAISEALSSLSTLLLLLLWPHNTIDKTLGPIVRGFARMAFPLAVAGAAGHFFLKLFFVGAPLVGAFLAMFVTILVYMLASLAVNRQTSLDSFRAIHLLPAL